MSITNFNYPFDSLEDAFAIVKLFEKQEALEFYLSSPPSQQAIFLDYLREPLDPFSDKYPEKNAGEYTWQFKTWKTLVAYLKEDAIFDSHFTIKTKQGYVVHPYFLNYQRFYPIITEVAETRKFTNPVLVTNFFEDPFITSTTLVYLPRKLVDEYDRYLESSKVKFDVSGGLYQVKATNRFGARVKVGAFSTEEEARKAYKAFKLETLTQIFKEYDTYLPNRINPDFCSRFQKHLETITT